MNIEHKVAEALFAQAEQVDLNPELWTRIRKELGMATTLPANQRQGRNIFRLLGGWRIKPLAFAGLAAALILATVLAIPSARTALAQWLGLSFEQTTSPNQIVQKVVAYQPLSESKSYEYYLYSLPKDRWSLIRENGFQVPQPGEQFSLPNGDQLAVPSYLPEGFAWQDVAATNQSMHDYGFSSLGSTSGGGGGLEPMPDFDRSFAAFLIGGDPANHYLVLAQFNDRIGTGLSIRTFLTTSPDRQPVPGMTDENPPENVVPTPTPVPQSFQAKLQIGVVVEPTQAGNGIALMVGPGGLHEVYVGENPAWWYHGAWNLQGEWIKNETLTNLVWKRGEHVYQLVGEDIIVETLIRIAESVK